jgi:endoglucanase
VPSFNKTHSFLVPDGAWCSGVLGQKYFGVNEAALGWGASAIPGKMGTNFPLISNASLDYFAAKGMNTIRVSIIWERLQPTLYGAFDATYVQYLVRALSAFCFSSASTHTSSLSFIERRRTA